MSNKQRKHPYTFVSNWQTKLSFWRNKNPGSLTAYNQEMYETILQGWLSRERNLASLQDNIGLK